MHLSNADAQTVLQVTLPDLPVALSAKFLLNNCGLVVSFPLHGGGSQPAADDRESQCSRLGFLLLMETRRDNLQLQYL